MREKHLFEYAVIRVVPRVEREEFLNVGVILYCADQKFLKCIFEIDETRLSAFACKIETSIILSNLTAIEKICIGGAEAGPIGQLDIASRFRWLTATRSTVVQASKVHPGFCVNAEETLQRLHQQLVL
ncbi:DUF3037 domain-containing protein [Pedobacter boryungensis]|uniref:DUF3037 domain-containing protein n=1 Tax=Pedobacter boryungensis TaxID=869962 RepID=A0ABX2D9J0_9SPHI|nr:DUF3037 domain-containing protein [Pedobacter boryungensis]NQX30710.1 DUF3037 domain-containing protein [Pedobacter boryungensis]